MCVVYFYFFLCYGFVYVFSLDDLLDEEILCFLFIRRFFRFDV